MAQSKVQIANMALAEVPAPRITSFEEEGAEAIAVRDHYQPALDMLLEAHDWDFVIRREALAQIVNDRPDEHAYCYAMPASVASPRRLVPAASGEGASPSVVAGLETVAYPRSLGGSLDEMVTLHPFTIADGRIYTDLESAILEYVAGDVSESAFTALFARALALELAGRIVGPIRQDFRRQAALQQMAEIARERAIADNMNRQPRQHFGFVADEALIRAMEP